MVPPGNSRARKAQVADDQDEQEAEAQAGTVTRKVTADAEHKGRIIRRGDTVNVPRDFRATWLGDPPKRPRTVKELEERQFRDETEYRDPDADPKDPRISIEKRSGPVNHPTRFTEADANKQISQERDLKTVQYQHEAVLGADNPNRSQQPAATNGPQRVLPSRTAAPAAGPRPARGKPAAGDDLI